MYVNTLGEIVAVRELSLVNQQGISSKVQVMIGTPKRFPDLTDYYCPFQIVGLESDEIRYAAGVDAVQALQLAMRMIGATLLFLSKKVDSPLQWEAGDGKGDLGFPVDSAT